MSDQMQAKDLLSGLFKQAKTEIAQGFDFLQDFVVPMSGRQLAGVALLRHEGFDDIADYLVQNKKLLGDAGVFLEWTDKLTMADRIKGNVRLANVVRNGDGGK